MIGRWAWGSVVVVVVVVAAAAVVVAVVVVVDCSCSSPLSLLPCQLQFSLYICFNVFVD